MVTACCIDLHGALIRMNAVGKAGAYAAAGERAAVMLTIGAAT